MDQEQQIIEVAIPLNINRTFSYSLPRGLQTGAVIGKRVMVDFKGRSLKGYAIARGKPSHAYAIKPIARVIDEEKIFLSSMVDFARWLADYYFAGLGEVLSVMVPRGIKPKYLPAPDPAFLPGIHTLSPEQETVFQSMTNDIKKGHKKFYLYGVTGSGKTEIFIHLIQQTLARGKGVIFLVPEIALSYQTLARLKKSFGSLCAVLHSNLSGSHRLGEYLRLLKGEAKIAVGPRSALFAPLEKIGLIIVDEENEGAYKSEESPRFHARTASIYRANKNKAVLVLASATPAVESWYYAQKGYFKLYSLQQRYGQALLPDIKLVQTNAQGSAKNLSLNLIEEINKRLQKKEQVIILQNRRGFANFITCQACQTIYQCPHCSISMTYHKNQHKLICHRCGYQAQFPEYCPQCGEKKIKLIGAGTQKIEEEIRNAFQHAVIQRIDYDLLKSEKNIQQIFKNIENGSIDIIVGTQMIAKGLHFPNIKFVGIINADLILNIPDFKAAERTYTLITQVAGRAGREGEKGEVMIQTVNPDHYSILAAQKKDFFAFYHEEIKYRSLLQMPPYLRLIRLIIRGQDEKKANNDVSRLHQLIRNNNPGPVQVLGPSVCLIAKINKNHRYQILLKMKQIEMGQKLLKTVLTQFKTTRQNYLEIDVDPVDLF